MPLAAVVDPAIATGVPVVQVAPVPPTKFWIEAVAPIVKIEQIYTCVEPEGATSCVVPIAVEMAALVLAAAVQGSEVAGVTGIAD